MLKRGLISNLLLICLVLILSISLALALVSQTPHGIKGFVLYGDGSQVSTGTSFSINDTTSGFFMTGTTNGPGALTGWFSASINGSNGDLVIIKAWNSTHYGLRLVELDGDMTENITLNVNNNAPQVQPVKNEGTERGVWISPEQPANNTDLVCNYELISDFNLNPFFVNYTWQKNGILVNRSEFFSNSIQSDTLFLASFDSTLNASYAVGDGNVTIAGTPNLISAKYENGANISGASDRLAYASTGNINTSKGTLDFWMRPNWDGNSAGFKIFLWSQLNAANQLFIYHDGSNILFGFGDITLSKSIVDWKAGEWHHLALVWAYTNDSSLGLNLNLQAFVDGVIFGQTSLGKTYVNQLGTLFDIGSYAGGGFIANATIDDFEISNEDKTNYQILKKYSEGIIEKNKISSGDVFSCAVSARDNTNFNSYLINSKNQTISEFETFIGVTDSTGNLLNTTLQAGKPTKLSVFVKHKGIAVSGAEVRIIEDDGFSSLAYLQSVNSNVTNSQLGYVFTDVLGFAELTFVPTGGRFTSDIIDSSNYDLRVDVYVSGKLVSSEHLILPLGNRRIDKYLPSYTTSGVPNYADYVSSFKWYQKFLTYYNKLDSFFA